MNFIKKINHINLLKFALGISLFSIGYLLTMFYYQMQELKENKAEIELHSKLNAEILHLQLALEGDSYSTESQLLGQNVLAHKTNLEEYYSSSFLDKYASNKLFDKTLLLKNRKIKSLIEDYSFIKDKLFSPKSANATTTFNSILFQLNAELKSYSIYLEHKVDNNNATYYNQIDNSRTTGFLIALVALVIFVLAYVKMNEDLMKLQKSADDAIFMNQTLNNAEFVAGFGSWKINTVENKFIISDNFYRLLGEKPNSFIPSMEKVMSYVHPDDREEVLKLHQESFKTNESNTIVYRYLLKDGTIKHMISLGKFLNNSKGELVKIGVNHDITELMKKSKELEEKNARLQAINSELESFNNIVGHDLQEPLRKIQMFISRIESPEFKEAASETTISYFEKIKVSAQRMQNLMTDLVDYTRTVKGDRKFEPVDLNSILEEITDELAFSIEEKNAKISIDSLPTVFGTRFQIQQLFMNLMTNALKYVKTGVAPIIEVRLETFQDDIVQEKLISSKDFYKITVADNGIGFEQKYADKIFMLFKRLETDQSYRGTGLGLAICKKIIDNNNGFIAAKGDPGIGSIFIIYLRKSDESI